MGSLSEKVIVKLTKYWDKKSHPTFDESLAEHLNINSRHNEDFRDLFLQYLGEDELIERLDNITNKYSTWTPINSCGTYEFDFVLRTFEVGYEEFMVYIFINVKLDGSVVIDGVEMSIGVALDNDDYGWVVSDEIKDCVNNTIHDEVERETGLYSHIQFI